MGKMFFVRRGVAGERGVGLNVWGKIVTGVLLEIDFKRIKGISRGLNG